jgi:glutathione peroxidase
MNPSRKSVLSLAAIALLTISSAFAAKTESLYDFDVVKINGEKPTEKMKLSAYKGKVLLIVNTASECGFTKQYKGLQALYDKYGKEGLVVLGFPSNDYGAQEPGSNAEIKNFCERNFKVTFPLFEKAPVSGNRAQPVYQYLVKNAPWKGAVGWNFEKFLVTRDGKISGRFKSSVSPEDKKLSDAIEADLKAGS